MFDLTPERIWILIAGALLILAILFFGRPRKPGQGRRLPRGGEADAASGRVEPTLGEQLEGELAEGVGEAAEEGTQDPLFPSPDPASDELGKRPSDEFDKIVTVYLAARAGEALRGPDIVVAAEKVGLAYGHMGVFHRLIERQPERGPVFSVANIVKPGSFDMAGIQSVETPAIAFFLTLPAPVSAMDAWDAMLPTAERMAELLGGLLLDEQRNALGRQRIGHIREELRAYDRQREAPPLTKPSRW
ncbi:cell division protein ZipA [Lysobacter sp. GX 14042]|uniref:cell division protein ZipA n=1 Tax=Lysobacter sp. GX 14042 TaxID=2907155 RepID=UPI001F40D03C|nr:cell division protein ZipA [Lysobacter sp. GX 14042]MCE7031242.1 cell division protein ZipA [Lysobacter sp. GX 14042]